MANTTRQLIEALEHLREEAECCTCLGDPSEFVLLPCRHSLCTTCFVQWSKKCPQCQATVSPSAKALPLFRIDALRFKNECSALINLLTPHAAQPSAPDLGRAIERQLLAGVPQVNIAVVGAEGAGKTALVSAVTGAPGSSGGLAALGTTEWSPYRADAQSKVSWWDSEGVSTWSNRKEVARLMTQLGQVERKHGIQFNLVIVLIRAWHKVSTEDLQKFLKQLQGQGKAFMVVTSDIASLDQTELKQRRDDVRSLLRPFGACRERNAHVDMFIATDAPDLFAITLNSTAHKASRYGPAVEQEGIGDLVICALIATLPSRGKDWLSGADGSRALTLLNSMVTSEVVISGGVLLLVCALASRNGAHAQLLDPLALLAESSFFSVAYNSE